MKTVYIAQIAFFDTNEIHPVFAKSKEDAEKKVREYFKNISIHHITINEPIS
jgi:hypothetical protein